MKVFVTGATGYIGSAVVRDLLGAGHQVVGLARSDKSAAALEAVGAAVHRGSLGDLDSLRRGADSADGVIHLAFIHDFSNIAASDVVDLEATKTMLAVLEGSGKPFVNTAGTLMLAWLKRIGTEEDAGPVGVRRVETENVTIAAAERGVRSAVVRLAPTVHGEGDTHGFIASLVNIARTKGVAAFVGDGTNRWPAVNRIDAARLYRLAIESAPAGARLHGVGEEGVPFRDIAEAIGRQLNVPVRGVTREAAKEHFGWLAEMVALDNPTSSALTKHQLGWQPQAASLIADIEQGCYTAE